MKIENMNTILLLFCIILTNINCDNINSKTENKGSFRYLNDKEYFVVDTAGKKILLDRKLNLKFGQEGKTQNRQIFDDGAKNLGIKYKNHFHKSESLNAEDNDLIEKNILLIEKQNSEYDSESDEKNGIKSNLKLNFDVEIEDMAGNSPLYCLSSKKKKNLVLVSTLDGQLNAIDYENGNVVWTFSVGNQKSLISSSLSKVDITANGQWMRLIPSLDGAIYKFDGENITPLPINADILLHSSYKFNEDTIITGGKTSEVIGLDPDTGDVKYSCSKDGCERSAMSNDSPLLVVTKESKVVRAVDVRTGEERWNFRVGQHFLQVAQPDCEALEDSEDKVDRLHFVIPEGLLKAEGQSGLLWTQKMPSPIVSAWKVTDQEAKILDLFSNTSVPALISENRSSPTGASLYVGYHKDEFYVQESLSFKNKVTSFNYDLPTNKNEGKIPKLKWRPYLATGPSKTPEDKNIHPLMIDYERNKLGDNATVDNTELAESGLYLFDDEEEEFSLRKKLPFAFLYKNSKQFEEFCAINNLDLIFEKLENKMFNMWTLFSLLLFGWISFSCTCCWFRLQAIRTFFMFIISCFFNKIFRLLQRAGVDLNVPTTKITCTSDHQSECTPDQINELIDRRISETSDMTAQQFSSRLCNEFTAIACLGKGGFGYVFNAQHKVDATNYAIKRIKLPTRQSSKVMREVYALAKLQHPNIVRYFSSWIETPPVDWQNPYDSLVNKKDASFDPDNWEETESQSCMRPSSNVKDMTSSSNISFNFTFGSNHSESIESASSSNIIRDITKCDESSSIIFDDTSNSDINFVEDSHSAGKIKSSLDISSATNSYIESPLDYDVNLERKRSRGRSESDNQRTYLYIQMELCQAKTLADWLEENAMRDMVKILHTFDDIVKAVEYIHDQGLIHRDLKPSNIFFSNDGNVKVGDFGLVTNIVDGVSQSMTEESVLMAKRTVKAGTELYMSPEQKEKRLYNHKVDIFSLGIIFYEMLVPFGTEMERRLTLMKVRQRDFCDTFQTNFPEECFVLNQALHNDADLRPTTRGLRSLKPLAGLQTDLLLIDKDERYILGTSHRKRLNSNNEHILV